MRVRTAVLRIEWMAVK